MAFGGVGEGEGCPWEGVGGHLLGRRGGLVLVPEAVARAHADVTVPRAVRFVPAVVVAGSCAPNERRSRRNRPRGGAVALRSCRCPQRLPGRPPGFEPWGRGSGPLGFRSSCGHAFARLLRAPRGLPGTVAPVQKPLPVPTNHTHTRCGSGRRLQTRPLPHAQSLPRPSPDPQAAPGLLCGPECPVPRPSIAQERDGGSRL